MTNGGPGAVQSDSTLTGCRWHAEVKNGDMALLAGSSAELALRGMQERWKHTKHAAATPLGSGVAAQVGGGVDWVGLGQWKWALNMTMGVECWSRKLAEALLYIIGETITLCALLQ